MAVTGHGGKDVSSEGLRKLQYLLTITQTSLLYPLVL